MNRISSLDKYLTTPPDDGFDGWVEKTCQYLSDSFFEENENWILCSGECGKWFDELFYRKGYSPKDSAKIIERGFKIYFNGKV